jgi:hypothetical protein
MFRTLARTGLAMVTIAAVGAMVAPSGSASAAGIIAITPTPGGSQTCDGSVRMLLPAQPGLLLPALPGRGAAPSCPG